MISQNFKITNGILTSYTGYETEVFVPDSVKEIGERVFLNNRLLREIHIGKSVTHIHKRAFACCDNLLRITIGENVSFIAPDAFLDCSEIIEVCNLSPLNIVAGESDFGEVAKYAKNVCKSNQESKVVKQNGFIDYFEIKDGKLISYAGNSSQVVIPANVTSIGTKSFYNNRNVVEVSIGDSVTEIDEYAFLKCCNLLKITIGKNVSRIGLDAFSGCDILEVCNLSELNIQIGYLSYGEVAKKAMNIYSKKEDRRIFVTKEGYMFLRDDNEYVLLKYLGLHIDLTLPKDILGNSYVIGSWCFSGSEIRSISLGGATTIRKNAFYYCENLIEVHFGEKLYKIDENAFAKCKSIKYIDFKNVQIIENEAFYYCTGLIKIKLGKEMQYIGYHAFYYCEKLLDVWNLSSLDLKSGESKIRSYAKNIYSENESQSKLIKKFDEFIFFMDDDENYLVDYIGNDANLFLPADIDGKPYSISSHLFDGRYDIRKVVIPNGVLSVGSYAFAESSVTEIIIADSVKTIGPSSFLRCKELETVLLGKGISIIQEETFMESHIGIIHIPNTIKKIGDAAFYRSKLSEIVIPSNIEIIGKSAFEECFSLAKLVIENGVKTIDKLAFGECHELKELYLPSSIENFGPGAFQNCQELVSVVLEEGITALGFAMFNACFRLKKVVLPLSIQKISAYSFDKCSLDLLIYKGSCKQWNNIELDRLWNYRCYAQKIFCADGEIEI